MYFIGGFSIGYCTSYCNGDHMVLAVVLFLALNKVCFINIQ